MPDQDTVANDFRHEVLGGGGKKTVFFTCLCIVSLVTIQQAHLTSVTEEKKNRARGMVNISVDYIWRPCYLRTHARNWRCLAWKSKDSRGSVGL